ncbi:MAG: hypothetical protein CM15mV51_1350 [uncultured marine virus]|nr:MAG: hypothetical protein CM15mV51_1350 [uncultured marine virus]
MLFRSRELKTVPVVATSILGVVESIEPYINKGISEQKTWFLVGSEEAVASRKRNKIEIYYTTSNQKSDLGFHGNLFGGKLLAWLDAAAAGFAAEFCDTPKNGYKIN